MKFLVLVLLLLVPATASAYVVYDITCDNVASVRIERLKDTVGNITSLGWYHAVSFELKPEAAQAFVRLRDATPMVLVTYRDTLYPRENIRVISHRRQLPLPASALTEHGDQGVTFIAVREREAFELAELVCPALVPAKVLVEGRLVDPDPANPPVPEASFPATGDLPYDLSCDNVARVFIVRQSDDALPGPRAPGDETYIVSFRLKPDAADRFGPILEESRRLAPRPGAPEEFSHRKIAVTTGGRPLRSDIPEIESHSGRSVNTYIFRKQDALATARLVCPTAPIELSDPVGTFGPGPKN